MPKKYSLKTFFNYLLDFSSKNPGMANTLITFLSALFVGTLFSVLLIGKNIIPTETDWLFDGDPATYQIGWLYFRNDSWHWPLTFTQNLGYPAGVSISYTDSVPIFAIVFKLLSSLIPHEFQYFGILLLINFVLQFFWGSQIGLLVSKGNILFSLGSGALFMLAPPFIWRLHAHYVLTSHWLILASLWSYLKLRVSDTRGVFLIQVVIIILASGINPYIAVMSLSFIVISHLELLGLKRVTLKIGLAKTFSLILLLLLGWYFFGYFSGTRASSVGNSYGVYSLNLSSVFNSMWLSSFLKGFPIEISGRQLEGFNYLGLGVLLLILTNLLVGALKHGTRLNSFLKSLREYRFLLILSILLTVISLSNKIYWQDVLVLEYPLPHVLEKLLGIFRCSGRLFWPVHYLILLVVLASTLRADL